MTGNNPPPSGVEPVMSNVEHIPTLEWKSTPQGLVADLGNGERLRIVPSTNTLGQVELCLNVEFLNTFSDPLAAMAYARTFVGDDE